jgi:NitT/TauT family transport system substrate-binding protein
MRHSATLARRRFLGYAGALVATGSFERPAFAQTKPSMCSNIANAAGATNLTMLQLMKQQKFLEEFGIADGSKIVSALLGGDMDISTMSGFGQVFPAIEKGGRLKILAGALLLPSNPALHATAPG